MRILRLVRSFTTALAFLALFFFSGCADKPSLIPLGSGDIPFFYDDLSKESLILTLEHQLDYLHSLPPGTVSVIDGKEYSSNELIISLTHFVEIVSSSHQPFKIDKKIRNNFFVYQSTGRRKGKHNEMLITAYYEPILEGSLKKEYPYIHPLYSQPTSLIIRRNKNNQKLAKGRLDDKGNFLPYWTRGEIETQNIAKGFELVYLKDPFDAFLLHIQGSGKIKLRDGSWHSIHYATDNGRVYNSIGKLLVDEDKMALKDVTIPSIKKFLDANPEEQERIFYHNNKYIFFKWEKENGPFGSLGRPLTPGRSIALDRKALPMTAIGYLITKQPVLDARGKVVGWKPLHRFVLPQDTGSAIKGAGRVDLFMGSGEHAKTSAGLMKESGKLYFLIKK